MIARISGLLVAAFTANCGAAGEGSLEVGSDEGGTQPVLGFADAGAPGALDAHIEQNHVAVTFVTVSCSGLCADVVAVATGGHAPYAFQWDDGPTGAARRVCPTESTNYSVTVTDTATAGELGQSAQTVRVPLGARVLACPDGGTVDGGGAKACGAGFRPGVYDGSFRQASGVLAGTHTLVLSKTAAAAGFETITGKLDAVLTSSPSTTSTVTWGEGSTFDCTTQQLFLTGARTDSPIMIPYTYEATYDPANGTLSGQWAAAAPPSPGVFPTTAIDSGTWDAHWVGP